MEVVILFLAVYMLLLLLCWGLIPTRPPPLVFPLLRARLNMRLAVFILVLYVLLVLLIWIPIALRRIGVI
jgi:hypothetical protein